MKVYIKSAVQISFQHPLTEEWLDSPEPLPQDGPCLSKDPVFSEWLSPAASRRMSPLMKRAVVTSMAALRKASVTSPDAIITGTGMGLIGNTEHFFKAILEGGEQCLPPTSFMNSTQNTISSQIAQVLGCHSYNSTYSHRGISFQSALWDGFSMIGEGSATNVLAGGFDETVQEVYARSGRDGCSDGPVPPAECAVSMVLSGDSGGGALCELSGVDILHSPSGSRLSQALERLLLSSEVRSCDISAVVSPSSGSFPGEGLCPDEGVRRIGYEAVCGRSFASPAFGVYMGAHICRRDGGCVLVFDDSDGVNVSLVLLKCSNC